jgi:glutamate synthase (NADPH/NADH) small chain
MILKTSTSHEEGGERKWSVLTKRFSGRNGSVEKLSCVEVEFYRDAQGATATREVPGSEFEIEADLVILALGFVHPQRKGLIEELGIELDQRGNVKADDNYMTSLKGVFAAGDMHRGQSWVVWAISEGRRAAHCIDKYLMGSSSLPML